MSPPKARIVARDRRCFGSSRRSSHSRRVVGATERREDERPAHLRAVADQLEPVAVHVDGPEAA